MNQIFHALRQACGSKAEEMHGPAKPGEQRRSVVDPSRAGKVLGWKAENTLEQGIAKTLAFFRERLAQ